MSHEGYLIIDHRASPGIKGPKQLGEGKVFEADTRSCGHCSIPIVMTGRTGNWVCSHCDSNLCDVCAFGYQLNGVCRPWVQVVDEVKAGTTPVPILAKDIQGL